jgi:hypothetical protein
MSQLELAAFPLGSRVSEGRSPIARIAERQLDYRPALMSRDQPAAQFSALAVPTGEGHMQVLRGVIDDLSRHPHAGVRSRVCGGEHRRSPDRHATGDQAPDFFHLLEFLFV